MRRFVESSSLKESAVRNHSPADRVTVGAGQRRLARAALAAITLATASTVGLGASAASAADPAWGYEQISPADGASIDVYGMRASEDMSTVLAMTYAIPLRGMPSDGRGGPYFYGLPRTGGPWTVGSVKVEDRIEVASEVMDMSPDGSRMFHVGMDDERRVDAQGGVEDMTSGGSGLTAWSKNLDAVAFLSRAFPAVYVGRVGVAPVQVSVDNAGNPMSAWALGGARDVTTSGYQVFRNNAFAADGSSVIFQSRDGVAGDNDGGSTDVFRRILTPGAEETVLISDVTDNGAPDVPTSDGATDPDVAYRWATADHGRVFFVSPEPLEPSDTDNERDIYLRDGKDAPVRVSQGELVDGSPTGNGTNGNFAGEKPEWVLSSQDGNRTFFVTAERLTQDAPTGGIKLYERDVAEGRTRFVAGPLMPADMGSFFDAPLLDSRQQDLSLRGLRVTPNGAVFMSKAPLVGSADDAQTKVFVWTRDGGLVNVAKPDADAPLSPPSKARMVQEPLGVAASNGNVYRSWRGGRGVSDDGSRVFFTTGQALTAQDTDGRYRDIYVWSKDEGVRLVTPPGREPYDASYVDSSPDGSRVYFSTSEGLLPSDTDPNAVDVYLAILGGGSPASPQVADADPRACARVMRVRASSGVWFRRPSAR